MHSHARLDGSVALIANRLRDDVDGELPIALKAILDRYPSPPISLDKDQLIEIAREKNGGKLAKSRALKALKSNSGAAIRRLTELAFAEPDAEIQMRLLIGMNGVRVPTASAILAWTHPDKFAVIDRRACYALKAILDVDIDPQSVEGWVSYMDIVRNVARSLGITPMAVDRRLYVQGGERPI